MFADRADADVEQMDDLRVRRTLADQLEDLPLPLGQAVERADRTVGLGGQRPAEARGVLTCCNKVRLRRFQQPPVVVGEARAAVPVLPDPTSTSDDRPVERAPAES